MRLPHPLPLHRFIKSGSLLVLAGLLMGAGDADLVNVRSLDPTIIVELRYAGTRNIAQRALYPADMPALLRPAVAQKLAVAQSYLRQRGYGVKVWDAYRPKAAHDQLWEFSKNNDYVANPADGRGSLHTWGVALDATLVDATGKEMEMPTDFDSFTPAAMLYYKGSNEKIRRNVHRLQSAMAVAGFYGLRTEWWHFVDKDWQNYRAIPEIMIVPQSVAAVPTPVPTARAVAPLESVRRNPAAPSVQGQQPRPATSQMATSGAQLSSTQRR